jgi:hypothetical protein
MNCHDQRARREPPCTDCVRKFDSKIRKKTDDEKSRCFAPFLQGTGWSKKKTDSGPDFRLTRSRHPSASGRHIGSSAGDGWAARRDPHANRRVFYWAGL